jgi:DNA-binding transcriptional MerR regulator
MTVPRYTIGEFSRLSRLTVTTLRHYDEIGLLPPAEVDPATGYRYYDAEQLPAALRLGILRSTGVPLADLLELVRNRRTLASVLERQRGRVEAERRAGRRLAPSTSWPGIRPTGWSSRRSTQPRTVAVLPARPALGGGADDPSRWPVLRVRRQRGDRRHRLGALFPVDPEAGSLRGIHGVDTSADLDVVKLPGARRSAAHASRRCSPALPNAARGGGLARSSRAGRSARVPRPRDGPLGTELSVLVAPAMAAPGQHDRAVRF